MKRSDLEPSRVVPGAAPGTIGPRRYSSTEMLRRANQWAARRDYPLITPAMLRELRKDRILEGPRRRGQGRGPGAAWDWSARDYRRLLRVIVLRANGIRRRDHQRIQLFLAGANLPLSDVRRALRNVYRANANQMNRDLRTDFWPVGVIPPTWET